MLEISTSIKSSWTSGGNGEIIIKNTSSDDIINWDLNIDFNNI